MHFVSTNCLNEVDQLYFNGTKAQTRRLAIFAVMQNVPGIRALPTLDEHTADAVAEGLMHTKNKDMTTRQKQLHKDGNLSMQMRKLSYRGAPRWRDLAYPSLQGTCA